ncbi:indirect negative regulator of sigma-B activity [Filobacillus milosensis]|uniref:Indirect negative regulator of sigma-B activity n=1 Tax=Filobacillus milosensis TaxID=94137 RepID=A0A4Y8IBL8_9BACI|nr:SpoIIE family protein phosphatase [Filobacillus milosensis]TFB13242.1 indirect negative regulator of sigma-B activity [Filobacillus milosensis]
MIEKKERIEVATFKKAKKGNYFSGDGYFYIELEDSFICVLADGLGSGKIAMASSAAVIDVVKKNAEDPLDTLLDKCNEAFSGNELRGCVIALLRVDYENESYSYVSFGNIGIITVTPDGKKKRNIPVHGYLSGIPLRNTEIHRGSLKPGTVFFMFSDGVNERQLTKEFYSHQSMSLTIEWYSLQQKLSMEDDTTLVAMKYTG